MMLSGSVVRSKGSDKAFGSRKRRGECNARGEVSCRKNFGDVAERGEIDSSKSIYLRRSGVNNNEIRVFFYAII
jgi:hypothetical protein